MSFEDDGDYEFQRYCRFVEEGPGFLKRYPLPPEKKVREKQFRAVQPKTIPLRGILRIFLVER